MKNRFLFARFLAFILTSSFLFSSCAKSPKQNASSGEVSSLISSLESSKTESRLTSSKTLSSKPPASSLASVPSKVSSAPKPQKEEKDNGIDVMAVGSSNLYRYFIPHILFEKYGFTSQVVSSAGMPGLLLKYYLEEAIIKYHPSLFIVDLRWFTKHSDFESVSKNGMETAYKAINKLTIPSVREKAALRILRLAVSGKPSDEKLKKDYPDWFKVSSDAKFFNENDIKKGFRPNSNHKKLDSVDFSKVTEVTKLPEKTDNYLAELLDFCRSKRVNVIFTFSPYLISEEDMKLNNYVAKVVKSYDYLLVDGNKKLDSIGVNYATDFYNEWHMNLNGAVKYTKFIGRVIMQNNSFNTRLSSREKEDWANALEKWDSLYDKYMQELNEKYKKAGVSDNN